MQKILTIVLVLWLPQILFAAPAIQSVSDTTPADGQTITITSTATNFGTGPTVYKWDDFEGSTHHVGHGIGAGPGSIAWGENSSEPDHVSLVTSGGKTNSTKYIEVDSSAAPGESVWGFHWDSGAALSKLYVSCWFTWDNNITATNCKLLDPANPAYAQDYYYAGPGVGATWQIDNTNLIRIAHDDYGDTGGHEIWKVIWNSIRPSASQWLRFEFYGVESDAGVANGTVIWNMQMSKGGLFTSLANLSGNALTRAESDEHWKASVFGRFPGGTNSGYDDIYIASSCARVEIGDNATWANCTHREIQIPTAWAAGEITATVNAGSFEGGTAYLFVVDSDGNVSDNDLETEGEQGYEITIGGSSPSTPSITGVMTGSRR